MIEEQMMKARRTHFLQSHRAQIRGWRILTWQENQKAGVSASSSPAKIRLVPVITLVITGALIFRYFLAFKL